MQPRPDYGRDSYRGSGRLSGKRARITGGDGGIGSVLAMALAREGGPRLHWGYPATSAGKHIADNWWIERSASLAPSTSWSTLPPSRWRAMASRTQLRGVGSHVQNQYLCDVLVVQSRPAANARGWRDFEHHVHPGVSAVAITSGVCRHQRAILTFTNALSHEAIKHGIRVNAVAPGPIWTPLITSTMPADSVRSFVENTPTERAGQPVGLAPIYVFLASPESSYSNGEVIGATGGRPVA